MAKSIRFTGFSKSNGSKLLNIQPEWWTVSELKSNVNFNWIKSNETGSYLDEVADISIEEARILHEQFKPNILEKIAYNVKCMEAEKKSTDKWASTRLADYTKYVAQLKAELGLIETALGNDAPNFSNFHVCVFEWDSGY